MTCKSKTRCDLCSVDITNNNWKRHVSKCDGSVVQFAGKRGGWNKGLTKETNVSVRKQANTYVESLRSGKVVRVGCVHTDEFKEQQSKRAHARQLGGHTSKRRMLFTRKDGKQVHLQSSYEIKFATLLEEMGVSWERPAPLHWSDANGVQHRYYADFKVGDVFIDTKNDYLAIKDLPKIQAVVNQNNVKVIIVTLDMITKEFIASIV